MTTQAVLISLRGPTGGRRFSATATDAAFTEITSETGTLSLYKVFPKGTKLTHSTGSYTAGIGLARIRNTKTQTIKAFVVLDVVSEEIERPLTQTVIVEDGDVLEAYTDVA